MATLAELDRALTDLPDDAYRVAVSSQHPATEAEVAALEAELGWALPAELRALYLRWGALIVEVAEAVWPRPAAMDVLPRWRFDPGVIVLGVGAALPPALTAAAARTEAHRARGELPWLRRPGGELAVLTPAGAAWCEDDDGRTPWPGDPVALVLAELRRLADGVVALRAPMEVASTLVAHGAAAGWTGPTATVVLDALALRPADELVEIAPALAAPLTGTTHVMGALDVLAAGGAAAVAAVADVVYGLLDGGDRAYVLELLGKIGATDARALAALRAGLADDDDDVVEQALTAVRALAGAAEVRALTDAVARVAARHDDAERRHQAIGALGRLGAPGFAAAVADALDALDSDDELADLLGELGGADAADALEPLAPRLLDRARGVDAGGWAGLAIVEALLRLGLRDPFMAPLAGAYQARGGLWAERAARVLAAL